MTTPPMSERQQLAKTVAGCLAGGLAALSLAACAIDPAPRDAAKPAASPAPPVAAVAAAPAPAAAPAVPAAPLPVLPFDEAVLSAANNLLGKSQLAAGPPHPRYTIVIDPLIDGVTGMQSTATIAMGARIVQMIRDRYPQYDVQPFSAANVQKSPLVLLGTFTGVGKERKTEGRREAYRICLALADLKSGKLVGKGLAFANMDGVDVTPTAYFRDAPAWTEDPATLGYIRTCQGTRAGDAIHPLYIDRILAAALIGEAIDAYGAGRYKEARDLYQAVLRSPEGQQMRVYSGLYLTHWRLGNKPDAMKAFGQLVDHGLENKRLGVKFLFRSGSTVLGGATGTTGTNAPPYPQWLTELSAQASKRQSCMEITGHASPTGPEPINERLSQLRAEYIKLQLERGSPALTKRLVANGVGSRETLIGNGRDDASDALDRRVEFKVIGC